MHLDELPAILEAIAYIRRQRSYISIARDSVYVDHDIVPWDMFGLLNRNAILVRHILGDDGLYQPDIDPKLN